MVLPTTLLCISPLEPPTRYPFSREPGPGLPTHDRHRCPPSVHRHPAAHLHSCSRGCSPPIAPAAACELPDSGLASSRGRLSPDIPNPSAPNELVASRGVDVPACTRTHAQVKPTDTTPLMETHPRRTVGTKSSIGERRGLTLSFSLRSVQKDQKQLLSVWLCKISKSVLICAD
ncbi:hypothetical protein JB92DRAFT_3101327 [Gautieria morchelliformis]|nr:hypothetical protein JB92DRAFT_3101327 [Gautieria morchelliformis]